MSMYSYSSVPKPPSLKQDMEEVFLEVLLSLTEGAVVSEQSQAQLHVSSYPLCSKPHFMSGTNHVYSVMTHKHFIQYVLVIPLTKWDYFMTYIIITSTAWSSLSSI